jgi:non-ribosomal peptide synthetase component F/acyl carrier protein
VLKTGAAFALIDADGAHYDGLDAVIVDGATADLAPSAWPLQQLLEEGARRPPTKAVPARDDELAFVALRSRAALRHGAIVNVLRALTRHLGLTHDDVVVAVTDPSLDLAWLELLLALSAGARLVIATAEEAGDGRLLTDLVAASGATLLHATATTWQRLLDAGLENPGLTALARDLSPPLARRLGAAVGRVVHFHGTSETTMVCLLAEIAPDAGEVSLGRPIANTTVRLLDRQAHPVPIGVAGALHVGGAALARGYLSDPVCTAARFVPDAGARDGGRLHATGVTARWLPDGRLAPWPREPGLGEHDSDAKRAAARVGDDPQPRTATQDAILSIWRMVLGIDDIGVQDDFFEVGGHSLHAVRMLTAVGQAFDVRLPINTVFEASTIEALAGMVDALSSRETR